MPRLTRLAPVSLLLTMLGLVAACQAPGASLPPESNPPSPGLQKPPPANSLSAPSADPGGSLPRKTLSFASDVAPIFTQNCAQCHSPHGLGYRRAPFLDAAGNPDYGYVSSHLQNILSVLQSGRMPPNGKLSSSDLQTLQDWANAGSPNN